MCDIIDWMIRSFADRQTERLFDREAKHKRLPDPLQRNARMKLVQIHRSTELNDLRIPPGNRLEALKGDRKGQHSIRINDQWRICFRWANGDAFDVEIVDYH